MKYLRKFNTQSEYDAEKTAKTLSVPNVSLIGGGGM